MEKFFCSRLCQTCKHETHQILSKLSSLFSAVNYFSAIIPRFPVIVHNLSHTLTNHPWKGDSVGRQGGMNGQSWNWPNHQVAQIWTVAGSRKHELNFQIFSSIKYFCQSNAFNVKIAFNFTFWRGSNIGCPNAVHANIYIFYCHHLHCTKCSKK